MYHHAVVIGRFQPLHTGHVSMLNRALEEADWVTVLVGSSNKAPDIKNPWSFHDRVDMINKTMHSDRIHILPLRDHLYSDALWVAEVQQKVARSRSGFPHPKKKNTTVLIGHEKDYSSYYLNMFGWPFIDPGKTIDINATELRYAFLETGGNMADELPIRVREVMGASRQKDTYMRLRDELAFLKKYWADTQKGPYPVQFQTVDAVVVQSGHILMIKRGGHPGRGLYALPGGYVQHDETIVQAVYRELLEETDLRVPKEVMQSSLVSREIYDAPNRDLRGRIITNAFTFRLPDKADLPMIQGGDDAAVAEWIPFGDLLASEELCFADHFHIALTSLGLRQ